MRTVTSDHFVSCIPYSEDDMLAICNSIVHQNSSAENFTNTIETMEQLIEVMRAYLERNRKKS